MHNFLYSLTICLLMNKENCALKLVDEIIQIILGYYVFETFICFFLSVYILSYVWAGIAQSAQRLATGWMDRGRNPGIGKIFFTPPERPWGRPSLLYSGYGVTAGIKRPRHGVNHPLPSRTEVKERVQLYSYSPMCLQGIFYSELYIYLYHFT